MILSCDYCGIPKPLRRILSNFCSDRCRDRERFWRRKGQTPRPDSGSFLFESFLEDETVFLQYDFEAEQRETRTDPGIPANVTITGVYLNDHWHDPGLFRPEIVERWEQAIFDAMYEW